MVNFMGYYDDCLEHHGIKGQKWGVRRFESANGHLTAAGKKRYEDGKVSSKEKNAFSVKAAGHKALAKVYEINEKTYSKSNKTLSSMNKAAKTQQLKKADAAQKEANAKRDAKEAYREKYNENLAKTRQNATTADKLIFNDATRKRAAKIMTDYKDVSVADAQKQANKEALRNTAILLGGYGAVALGAVALSKR